MTQDGPQKVQVPSSLTASGWQRFIWDLFPRLWGKPFTTRGISRQRRLITFVPGVPATFREAGYQGVVFVEEQDRGEVDIHCFVCLLWGGGGLFSHLAVCGFPYDCVNFWQTVDNAHAHAPQILCEYFFPNFIRSFFVLIPKASLKFGTLINYTHMHNVPKCDFGNGTEGLLSRNNGYFRNVWKIICC